MQSWRHSLYTLNFSLTTRSVVHSVKVTGRVFFSYEGVFIMAHHSLPSIEKEIPSGNKVILLPGR
jgi:hypothetical protein